MLLGICGLLSCFLFCLLAYLLARLPVCLLACLLALEPSWTLQNAARAHFHCYFEQYHRRTHKIRSSRAPVGAKNCSKSLPPHVSGDPLPSVFWYRNDKLIDDSDMKTFDNTVKNRIVLSNLVRDDLHAR